MHTYLPHLLPAESIYQPSAPKPEDVAVLIEGDEEVDLDTLRAKGEVGLVSFLWCSQV